jgi:hypothetical protein
MDEQSLVPVERIERSIIVLRGQKVIIDETLAALYGVSTKRLNEQVKRNSIRFPLDFTFQLSEDEYNSLRSQIATLETIGRGRHRKYLPYAFTEHGAIMVAAVLNSPQAIAMSILVVRVFVKLRNILATHRQLAARLSELESKLSTHDEQIILLFDAIRGLMAPPEGKKRKIGFKAEEPRK